MVAAFVSNVYLWVRVSTFFSTTVYNVTYRLLHCKARIRSQKVKASKNFFLQKKFSESCLDFSSYAALSFLQWNKRYTVTLTAVKKKMETLKINGINGTCSEASIEKGSVDCWECGAINCEITGYIQAMLEALNEY